MAIPPPQREVADFLSKLAGDAPVETHISAVYVGKDEAWKLKKSVRLAFLDFSTLDARHRFLRRELELNRPDAPEIYRDLAAVERARDGSLVLRPEHQSRAPLEWVLRMARIPPADFLDTVAERDGLTAALLDALGDCVARSHQTRPPIRDWDSAGALWRVADDCAASALAAGLPIDDVEDWQHGVQAVLERDGPWFAARAAAGFVRRCHADLHLGNLCLWHGTPVPFDALEFDEELGTIDVGYDLAFLLMDLDRRVGRPAANRVMNRYIARTGDAGLSRALPALMSVRAMVRARVHAASRNIEAARLELATAREYLQPAAPMVLAIGGLPGSGKSTLARRVAAQIGRPPGAVVVRSDEIRKRAFGVAPEQKLPDSAYREAPNVAVGQELAETTQLVAGGGHSVIADATFMDGDLRQAIAAAAGAAQAPFVGVWLTAPRAVLEARVSQRRGDASDANLAVLHAALARNLSTIHWLHVDTTDFDAASRRITQAVAALR
jgi:uncharacterized protein